MAHQCHSFILKIHALDPNTLSVNSLGPKFCCQPIGLLNYGGPLVLDHRVNPLLSGLQNHSMTSHVPLIIFTSGQRGHLRP
jgi:hypothetical protein